VVTTRHAIAAEVRQRLDGRRAVRVVYRPNRLRPGIVRRELYAAREPPVEPGLQAIVLARAKRSKECRGGAAAELLEQRSAGRVGADHLAGVDVEIAE